MPRREFLSTRPRQLQIRNDTINRCQQKPHNTTRNENGNQRLFIGLFLVLIAADIIILMIVPMKTLHKIINGGVFFAKMIQGFVFIEWSGQITELIMKYYETRLPHQRMNALMIITTVLIVYILYSKMQQCHSTRNIQYNCLCYLVTVASMIKNTIKDGFMFQDVERGQSPVRVPFHKMPYHENSPNLQ